MQDLSVDVVQDRFQKVVRALTFPYAIKPCTVKSIDKGIVGDTCTVELADGFLLEGVILNGETPKIDSKAFIVCYDSDGQTFYLLNQSVIDRDSFDKKYNEVYKLEANEIKFKGKVEIEGSGLEITNTKIKIGDLTDIIDKLASIVGSIKVIMPGTSPLPIDPKSQGDLLALKTQLKRTFY